MANDYYFYYKNMLCRRKKMTQDERHEMWSFPECSSELASNYTTWLKARRCRWQFFTSFTHQQFMFFVWMWVCFANYSLQLKSICDHMRLRNKCHFKFNGTTPHMSEHCREIFSVWWVLCWLHHMHFHMAVFSPLSLNCSLKYSMKNGWLKRDLFILSWRENDCKDPTRKEIIINGW